MHVVMVMWCRMSTLDHQEVGSTLIVYQANCCEEQIACTPAIEFCGRQAKQQVFPNSSDCTGYCTESSSRYLMGLCVEKDKLRIPASSLIMGRRQRLKLHDSFDGSLIWVFSG